MSRLRAALPLLLLIAAGLVLFASGALDRLHPQQLLAHQVEMHAQLDAHPWLSRLAYIGLLTLGVSTGIPGTIIIILAGGFAFGIIEGTLCSSAGLTLGSLVLYLASRYAFGAGTRRPPPAAERLRHGFARHPLGYTLFLRSVPVAPFGLVTLTLAWLRCPLWLFLGATWLGGTVSLAFETSVGAGLGQALGRSPHLSLALLAQKQVLLPLLAILALALLPLLIRHLLGRWRRGTRP